MEYFNKKVITGKLIYSLMAGYEFSDNLEIDDGKNISNLIKFLRQFDGKKVSITVEPLDDLEYEGY